MEHEEKVRTACFNPDGKWFVTASADSTARVWNAETGDPLTPPLRHLTKLNDAVFLADGRHIVTHDTNKECRIWPLAVNDWPIDDLVNVSGLLSGRTETRFDALGSQGSDSLETAWKRFRNKYPATFVISTEEIEKWHEFQAEDCDIHRQWSAELFHLKQLIKLRPGNQSIMKRIGLANGQLPKEK